VAWTQQQYVRRARRPCDSRTRARSAAAGNWQRLFAVTQSGRASAERYRLATEQIVHAERLGFDSAWIAQHHFHEGEGGLPAPFVFLTHAAAATSRIRLGTGIVTLPLELPVRVAEDAVVLDLLCDHRLEVGVGPGGNLTAFTAFGLDSKDRHRLMNANLDLMRTAWAGAGTSTECFA